MIVEDHRIVTDGLAALLNGQPDMAVVGSAGSVAESLTRIAEQAPDVVAVDFRLPGGTGAEAGAPLCEIRPEAELIFLSRYDSDVARNAAAVARGSAVMP